MIEFIKEYWFIVLIGIIIFWFLIVYNTLIRRSNSVKSAKATIEVYLKQRFDLIPSLIEVVKGYSNYEKSLLTDLADLRSFASKNENIYKNNLNNDKLNRLIVTIESYPELKASEQYLKLQKSLIKAEDLLQAARRIYNIEVEKYNNAISVFPSNIVSNLLGYKQMNYIQSSNEENNNIKVNL